MGQERGEGGGWECKRRDFVEEVVSMAKRKRRISAREILI